jgi:hypothetical protein
MLMKRTILLAVLILVFLLPSAALAQSYYFSLDRLQVDVFLNGDGTVDLLYRFTFTNSSGASPIDFVDVGLPNQYYDENNITAEVDGNPVSYISSSDYEGSGTGVAVALGGASIQPGQTGTVTVYVPGVERTLRPDSQDKNYASLVFSPTWFDSQFVYGSTDVSVTLHMPPGVQPQEPRWHQSPPGWASEPETGVDNQGRVTYTWRNSRADGYTQYKFGASVPRQYLAAGVVRNVSLLERLNISGDTLVFFGVCTGFLVIFVASTAAGIMGEKRRRMQYLPPKISVEGHGIKRGLTAVEAAILMEQPMDKILTMILFAVIKKNAASVKTKDPLDLEIADPLPQGLNPYEEDFLHAFQITRPETRQKELQNTMITLVKSVATKMKGFSRKETLAYYKDIIERAWGQVESAGTPEVKSVKYDEVMEWTMLDKDYDDRTRDVFREGPVFLPSWWGRYEPGTPHSAAPVPSGGGGSVSLPNLPGSDFAASMVNSVQTFSGNVVGNISEFTSGVTSKTNPPPPPSSRGSGGGGGGCACACAGCACACAGGGR